MHREVFIECVELDAWGLASWLPLQGHQFAHLENGEPGAQQCLAGGSWEAEFTLIPQQAVFSTQHPEGRLLWPFHVCLYVGCPQSMLPRWFRLTMRVLGLGQPIKLETMWDLRILIMPTFPFCSAMLGWAPEPFLSVGVCSLD